MSREKIISYLEEHIIGGLLLVSSWKDLVDDFATFDDFFPDASDFTEYREIYREMRKLFLLYGFCDVALLSSRLLENDNEIERKLLSLSIGGNPRGVRAYLCEHCFHVRRKLKEDMS